MAPELCGCCAGPNKLPLTEPRSVKHFEIQQVLGFYFQICTLPSHDVRKLPRILVSLDLKLILLVNLKLTGWQ